MSATQPDVIQRDSFGKYPSVCWPGLYTLVYITADGGILCAECANSDGQTDDPDDPQWHIVQQTVIWEGPSVYCDHCNVEIESAYGGGWRSALQNNPL